MVAERAVASRALGGVVSVGETPPWAFELQKAAAAVKLAEPVPAAAPAPAATTAPAAATTPAATPAPSAASTVMNHPGVRNALTGGLIGAGGGALLGLGSNLLSSNKRKRPFANALFGGVLGGLGGAAVGGLGGSMFGSNPNQEPSTSNKRILDNRINETIDKTVDAGNPSADKTFDGLRKMGPKQLGKGVGYGAAIGAGLGTVPEVAGRSLIRAATPMTQHAKATADDLRKYLTTAHRSVLVGAPSATAADTVKNLGGPVEMSHIKARLGLVKDNPLVSRLGGLSDDSAVAKALMQGTSGRVPIPGATRIPLIGDGTAVRGLKGGLIGAMTGLATTAANKGIENATSPQARIEALTSVANDMRARFPNVGTNPAADPQGAALRQKLTDVIGRLNSVDPKNPATIPPSAELEKMVAAQRALFDQFRNHAVTSARTGLK